MRIDGKALADAIFSTLAQEALHPTLAVILVGDNPESLAYIRQKQKATERLGGHFIFEHLPAATSQKELDARVAMYNSDPAVAGLIVQRPIAGGLTATVVPAKDIDGFETNSPFEVPIAMAIFTILKHIFMLSSPRRRGSAFIGEYQNRFPVKPGMTFVDWLRSQRVTIVGRGETAGKPIAAAFAKQQCATSIISSQTPNPKEIMKTADILISCVGKQGIVTPDAVKPGAILISVGLSRGEDGKLHGDYHENAIADIAGAYTPTPGGVGPVNIACLMQNLVKASHYSP